MTTQPPKATLADLVLGCANAFEDRIALSDEGRKLSYRQLAEQAAQLAHVLHEDGVGPGDQVGVALRDGIDGVLVMTALWMLDAVVVLLDFRSRVDARNRLAESFDLLAVIEDRALPDAGYRQISLNDVEQRARLRPVTAPLATNVQTYPALISLSSGTTGDPIGMVTSHRALAVRTMAYGMAAPYPQNSRYLNVFPLSFTASYSHTLGSLLRGTEVIFYPPTFGASELIETIRRLEIGFFFAVPATVREMLVAVGETGQPALPSLKMLLASGAGVPAADKLLAARHLTPTFATVFSSTTTGTVSQLAGPDLLAHPETEGRVLPWIHAEIVSEQGQVLPRGETGALRVRSLGAGDGIYEDRDRAGGDRIRNGWGYTGDLGHIDRDGMLTISGRAADMIIRGGANVYPAEIEGVLARLNGVREVAVTGFAVEGLGDEIAAFVVAAPELTEGELMAYCRTQLLPDKRPRRFIFVDALPRNPNGKVLRRELREKIEKEA
jgi:acyl-CoA synthetase (AMP-forming)/AMP-acid ligase II